MNPISTDKIAFRIDEDSFKEIYNLYWEKVFSVCYTNLGEPEVAKGMVQEIFKSLWERKAELEINQSVEKYLLRSAKFKVFEHFRNKKIREQHHENMIAGQATSFNYTENEVMAGSLRERIASLVETLPAQCRKVFKMSREQGLSNKEIATDLLISERAVEYHISRAVTSLKSHLSEYSC